MYRAYLRELVNYKNVPPEEVERSLTISPQSFDSIPSDVVDGENIAPGCETRSKLDCPLVEKKQGLQVML
ncbi:hypothetical protein ElyMa_003346300 [Elysia marginata]|uniref:Uncharacterized protein n=1 Tax=Elysia marginata TaxID=1093978 RepID=A0AAV4JFX1_9GAST|nr:hypothetical protein ElyMa_003346300 [Elysia marginata]